MLAILKKRWAIRSYVKRLGPVLRRRCGRKRYYTPEEVRRAARASGVNTDYLCYAYCIYCSREAFDQHHRQTGEPCNYDTMCQEIGSGHFLGNTAFDAADALDSAHSQHSESSWFSSENSSHSHSWSDSGGGDSGGGDGGSDGD
jgi:hypothetical protein